MAEAAEKKKRTNPLTFLREVRAEGRKVTWTSRQETVAAMIMVFIMIIVATLFFFLVDQISGALFGYIQSGDWLG